MQEELIRQYTKESVEVIYSLKEKDENLYNEIKDSLLPEKYLELLKYSIKKDFEKPGYWKPNDGCKTKHHGTFSDELMFSKYSIGFIPKEY